MKGEIIYFENKEYILEKMIGEGNYGQVWLAKSDGSEIVAKKIVLDSKNNPYHTDTWGDYDEYETMNEIGFRRETELVKKISKIKCPSFRGYNIESFLWCSETTGFVIDPDQFLIMAKHLFRGLACLHKHGIIHTDIHTNNVMFNKKEMKIIDFGWLCTMPPSPDKDFSCYTEGHFMAKRYSDEVEQFGKYTSREEFPFYNEVRDMGVLLRRVAGEKFEVVHKKDPRTLKIINWLDDLETRPPKYTAKEALGVLEKISGVSKDIY
jgi:hypothetical protein